MVREGVPPKWAPEPAGVGGQGGPRARPVMLGGNHGVLGPRRDCALDAFYLQM